MYLPVSDSAMADTDDFAHTLGASAKLRMTEETAHVYSDFVFPNVKKDETISLTEHRRTIKAMI